MKRTIIIVAIGCITTGLFAQSKRASRVSPWDSLYFKNEISLDVSPAISGLFGDIGYGESFGATYRLFFNKRNAFRASYRSTFDFSSTQRQDVESIGYRPIEPGRLDSIIVIAHTIDRDEWTDWHTLRAGIEHRFGKRRIKFVLGIDIIMGVEKWERQNTHYTYETLLPFDTSGTAWSSSIFSDPFPFPGYANGETVWSFIVGVTPVFGLNLNLTKRWSLNASILYDLFGYFPFKYSDDINRNHVKGFYGYAEAPMTDFSVTYHFGR